VLSQRVFSVKYPSVVPPVNNSTETLKESTSHDGLLEHNGERLNRFFVRRTSDER
jgi:hypothetical protein